MHSTQLSVLCSYGCRKCHGPIKSTGSSIHATTCYARDLQNQGYHGTRAVERVRNIYMEYFNSNVGAVPWQGNKIRHR